jgi:hypothetical protein
MLSKQGQLDGLTPHQLRVIESICKLLCSSSSLWASLWGLIPAEVYNAHQVSPMTSSS